MTKFSGPAAEARLTEAWEMVFARRPETQEIVHVLTRPTEYPHWLTGFPPFDAWTRNGCAASDEVWQTFRRLADSWPYVQNARRARSLGIPNTRIHVLLRAGWDCAPPWLRYLAEVHLPAISALAGETLYRVWLEDARGHGIPDRDEDVNLWGAGGVMLAGYENGDVSWRGFPADDQDPAELQSARAYLASMRDLALTDGEAVKLPDFGR